MQQKQKQTSSHVPTYYIEELNEAEKYDVERNKKSKRSVTKMKNEILGERRYWKINGTWRIKM